MGAFLLNIYKQHQKETDPTKLYCSPSHILSNISFGFLTFKKLQLQTPDFGK